jgi:hypothetical protein
MSNRAIYAIIAAVALAAIGGFYLMLRGDGDAVEVTAAKKAEPGGGFTGPGHGPAAVPGTQPRLADGSDTRDLPDKVKEYAANGAIIRDHRTGSHAPIDLDPNAAPPNTRKLQPTLTKAVSDKIRDVMHECVATLPANVRGERPRLEGTINIAIKDKVVSINKAQLAVKDVVGDAAEATRTCIETKSMAVTQAAGDEQDLPSYDINLSFTLI